MCSTDLTYSSYSLTIVFDLTFTSLITFLLIQVGGIQLDLGLMRSVHVDVESKTAWIDGGALIGDVDAATTVHNLATPGGQVSHTGYTGLTIGGGYGILSPLFGLGVDNVLEAEVVLADGRIVHASDDGKHADLMFGIRGGGGNFGVVTRLKVQLHDVCAVWLQIRLDLLLLYAMHCLLYSHSLIRLTLCSLSLSLSLSLQIPETLYGGMVFYDYEHVETCLGALQDLRENDDRAFVALICGYPPFLQGKHACGFFFSVIDTPENGKPVVDKVLQSIGAEPLMNTIGPVSYPQLNTLQDPLAPYGAPTYMRSIHVPVDMKNNTELFKKLYDSAPPNVVAIMGMYSFLFCVWDVVLCLVMMMTFSKIS
jgi:FAD binding domain